MDIKFQVWIKNYWKIFSFRNEIIRFRILFMVSIITLICLYKVIQPFSSNNRINVTELFIQCFFPINKNRISPIILQPIKNEKLFFLVYDREGFCFYGFLVKRFFFLLTIKRFPNVFFLLKRLLLVKLLRFLHKIVFVLIFKG